MNAPNLLGIETSSPVGSIALCTPTGTLVREIATPREQTERLLALTDELLAAAGIGLQDLHGIAFGRGPGSFTGLRVSAAIAQGLSAASGVALLPVSSLLCLAERAWREHGSERVLVCVDAHMGEVYFAAAERRGQASADRPGGRPPAVERHEDASDGDRLGAAPPAEQVTADPQGCQQGVRGPLGELGDLVQALRTGHGRAGTHQQDRHQGVPAAPA